MESCQHDSEGTIWAQAFPFTSSGTLNDSLNISESYWFCLNNTLDNIFLAGVIFRLKETKSDT